MKKIKMLLSALVIVLAVGAAFASKTFTSTTGYKKTGAGSFPSQCANKGTCANEGEYRCSANDGGSTVDLFKLNGSVCDVAVNHTSPDPI